MKDPGFKIVSQSGEKKPFKTVTKAAFHSSIKLAKCQFLHVKLMGKCVCFCVCVRVRACRPSDQTSLCVWSFRHVCAVGVFLFKLLPMTRCSLFWSPERRIKPQSRAATSKPASGPPHLRPGRPTPYRVNKTGMERRKNLSHFFIKVICGYQSGRVGSSGTPPCHLNNMK